MDVRRLMRPRLDMLAAQLNANNSHFHLKFVRLATFMASCQLTLILANFSMNYKTKVDPSVKTMPRLI